MFLSVLGLCGMPRYDCDAGVQNWQVGWSNSKMDYCCQAKGMLSGKSGTDCRLLSTRAFESDIRFLAAAIRAI